MTGRRLFSIFVSAWLTAAFPASSASTVDSSSSALAASAGSAVPIAPVLQAMGEELDRSFDKLKNTGDAPLYYLGYRLYETRTRTLEASYGAITTDTKRRTRTLTVDARVGSRKLDNSHGGNRGFAMGLLLSGRGSTPMPLDDDVAAMRNALWLETDNAVKAAQRGFAQVKTSKDIKVEEEDTSDDFSAAQPVTHISPKTEDAPLNNEAWKERLRQLSQIYKKYPNINKSSVEVVQETTTRYLLNSEGTRVEDQTEQVRFTTKASTTLTDGMELNLYDLVSAFTPGELPDQVSLAKSVQTVADNLVQLSQAKLAEPYAGPAILSGKAAAVFFHEILGHRVEGHRQKDEREGKTFTKKVNEQILPAFISVVDDPTLKKFGQTDLAGYYQIDDEGVPAQKVNIVDKGILRNFLMCRSPIEKFSTSNGHGRCSPGMNPVARQGNLMVQSDKCVSREKLRQMLIEEAKKQGKPYGLLFDEIAGGFAVTQAMFTQAFKLMPLRVTRIWADGRPDELIRGVSLVGTPLVSLETIVCAGDDYETFNGVCGAESGWVPVSASAPSLLVKTVEVARDMKSQTKPPLLPAPLYDGADNAAKRSKPANKNREKGARKQ